MARFRVAQISDLHLCTEPDWVTPYDEGSITDAVAASYDTLLGNRSNRGRFLPNAYPSSFSSDLAAALLKHLIPKIGELDALIVSGDLATTGRSSDLQIAKDFLASKLSDEWNPWAFMDNDTPTLLSNRKNCVVSLPGNHDRYDGILAQPGARVFERYFGENWDLDRGHAIQPLGISNRVRVVKRTKDDCILFLCLGDCSLNSIEETQGFGGRWGQGIVTDQVLGDFEQATTESRQQAKDEGRTPCIVWVVHFPPLFPEIEKKLELIAGKSLVLSAEKCGVDMILSGHTHQALGYKAPGKLRNIPVYGCGSAIGLSKRKTFEYSQLDIDISPSGSKVHPTNFVWSDELGNQGFKASDFPMWPPKAKFKQPIRSQIRRS